MQAPAAPTKGARRFRVVREYRPEVPQGARSHDTTAPHDAAKRLSPRLNFQ